MLDCGTMQTARRDVVSIFASLPKSKSVSEIHTLADEIVPQKICNECTEAKAESEFYSDKAKKDGLSSRCRCCISKAVAKYRETNRERLRLNAKSDRDKCPERGIWQQIVSRCTNPENYSFHNYGGRGIGVAPEWIGPKGFEAFLAHIGKRPTRSHTVDRIDNNGNYEPGNVRWATRREQSLNTRRNRILTINGTSLTSKEWSELSTLDLGENTISNRSRAGWSDEEAVLTPLNPPRKRRIA